MKHPALPVGLVLALAGALLWLWLDRPPGAPAAAPAPVAAAPGGAPGAAEAPALGADAAGEDRAEPAPLIGAPAARRPQRSRPRPEPPTPQRPTALEPDPNAAWLAARVFLPDGRPAGDVEVAFAPDAPDSPVGEGHGFAKLKALGGLRRTGRGGRVQIPDWGVRTRVMARSDAGAAAGWLSPSLERDIELRMHPEGRLRVRLLDPAGAPLVDQPVQARCSFELHARLPPGAPEPVGFLPGAGHVLSVAEARTDSEGRATLQVAATLGWNLRESGIFVGVANAVSHDEPLRLHAPMVPDRTLELRATPWEEWTLELELGALRSGLEHLEVRVQLPSELRGAGAPLVLSLDAAEADDDGRLSVPLPRVAPVHALEVWVLSPDHPLIVRERFDLAELRPGRRLRMELATHVDRFTLRPPVQGVNALAVEFERPPAALDLPAELRPAVWSGVLPLVDGTAEVWIADPARAREAQLTLVQGSRRTELPLRLAPSHVERDGRPQALESVLVR